MRLEMDGKFYRYRRGRLVLIPSEWVDKIPTQRTMRNRQSKSTRKLRNLMKGNFKVKIEKVEKILLNQEMKREPKLP